MERAYMKIDFYYWGNICPITDEMIELFNKYNDNFFVELHDISDDWDLAKNHEIYFPFLTIIDDTRRFYSPISDNFIQELMSGKIPIEKPYLPKLGGNIYYGKIEPINKENYELASLCTGRTKCKGCNSKIKMYQDNLEDIFGFVNIKDNELVGGAEFFPSIKVPYNIPKAKDIAFITCVYSSDEYFDYKTKPLEELEKYLSKKYTKVIVISDEKGVFPNGDLDFFKRNGYIDEKVIFEDAYCKLHLLWKKLVK